MPVPTGGWTNRLAPQLSDAVLVKGRLYFRAGRVDIEAGGHNILEATVHGTHAYQVRVSVHGKDIQAACTCPYFEKGDVCKHIWAALLAAEDEHWLEDIAFIPHPYIDVHFMDFVNDEFHVTPAAAQNTPPPAKQAVWRHQLENLRSTSAVEALTPADPTRRALYVIDSQASSVSGRLLVRVGISRKKKKGEWTPANFQDSTIRDLDHLGPEDQRILSLMAGGKDTFMMSFDVPTRYKLPGASHQIVMPLLCETGRCFLKLPNSDELGPPLVWDDGPSWSVQMAVQRNEADECYELTAWLRRGADTLPLNDASLLIRDLLVIGDRAARCDNRGTYPWIVYFRHARVIRIPFDARSDFISELARFPALPPMDMPKELQIEQRSPDGPPSLKIHRPEPIWNRQPNLQCDLIFHYGSLQVSELEKSSAIFDPATNRFFKRDLEVERNTASHLSSFGIRPASGNAKHRWELPPSKLAPVTRALLAEGWRVEADGKLYRRSGQLRVQVSSGIDWFELDAEATFDDQVVRMPEILKAISKGETSVQLGDGSFGLLPEEWLERYRLIADFGTTGEGQLRFKRHQAGLLDALLASEPEVTFDATFLKVRQELENFGGIKQATATDTFRGELRGYQREGLGWLYFLRRFGFGGCLADDMGLGKTVQVLALLDAEARTGPALVVVPRSLVFNWKQEAAHFAPRLKILDQTSLDRQHRWTQTAEFDIVIVTYGTLRRDILTLKEIEFDTIILDEAQAIKNAASESAKAVRLLKSPHRLVLTGTPIENRLNDLWSLFEFLNPGMLGSAAVFRSHAVAKPGEQDEETGNEPLRMIAQALRPFILRRTKEQVAQELPAKTEQTIYCELPPEQRRTYDELRDHYRESLLGRLDKLGLQKTRMHILEALLRLRQAACHPGLIDKVRKNERSGKIDALLPQVKEVLEEGHKALVFSQFTSLLSIVRTMLDGDNIEYEYLDGKTRDREARVRRFQEDPNCRLFLISLKAGGLGLNLTAAEYVFLLDPWWNPAVEAQAIDRSHRIGQTKHVFAYRLIAQNTVEEKVLELQKTKLELADAIINADNSLIAGLTREHLELLLS
jgi:superfamily II DNA or RNA helicase